MRILDMGSGNTSKNDINIIKKMIDSVAEVDPERKFIIKWQLFEDAPPNVLLFLECFEYAYHYAKQLRYKTTASVFDIESLNFLLQFDVPFIKLANRPDLYWLIGEVPRRISVIASFSFNNTKDLLAFRKYNFNFHHPNNIDKCLFCVSKYPATMKDYEDLFGEENLHRGMCLVCGKKRFINNENVCYWCFEPKSFKRE